MPCWQSKASREDLFRLGYAFFKMGDDVSARSAFAKMEPADGTVEMYLGHIARRQGDIKDARRHYLAAIQKDASLVDCRIALAELEMKEKEYLRAARQYGEIIRLGRREIEVFHNHLSCLTALGESDRVREALKVGFRHHGPDRRLLLLLEELAAKEAAGPVEAAK